MTAQHAQPPGSAQAEVFTVLPRAGRASLQVGRSGSRPAWKSASLEVGGMVSAWRGPGAPPPLYLLASLSALGPDRGAGHPVAGQRRACLPGFPGLKPVSMARQVVWPRIVVDSTRTSPSSAAWRAWLAAWRAADSLPKAPTCTLQWGTWIGMRCGMGAALASEIRVGIRLAARGLTGTSIRSKPWSSRAAMCTSRSGLLAAPSTTPTRRTSPRTAEVTRLWPEASI